MKKIVNLYNYLISYLYIIFIQKNIYINKNLYFFIQKNLIKLNKNLIIKICLKFI